MKITFNIELFILQLIAIIILVFIIFQILKVIKSYKLEKRIATYGIDSLNNTTNSIFDIIIDKYNRIIKSISLVLKKSHIIKKYYSSSVQQDDLISIGTIGLIKAINTFDPDKGTRLATYAARCIENAILSQASFMSSKASFFPRNHLLEPFRQVFEQFLPYVL